MTATLPVAALAAAPRAAAVPLVREWLSAGDQLVDLAGTWPQIYHPLGAGRSFGIVDGDRPVAHAAVTDVTLVTGRDSLRARLIGSVATDPARRGAGLASRLLAELTAAADRDGVDACLLWSRRPDFYARFGFAPGGDQRTFTLAVPAATDTGGVRLALARDVVALHRLHCEKPLRVERSLGEMALLLSAAAMQVVVRELRGVVTAYACLGKGSDFALWWHEVGGDDAQVARLLLAATAGLELDAPRVLLPAYRPAALTALADAVRDCRSEPSALVRWRDGVPPRAFHVDGLDSI